MPFNYKKIIKNRNTRIFIMRLLSFVPDKLMLKIQYKIKTGHKLNLKDPKRYTEKLQWYKLYYRDSLMAQCADKYEVRKYVTNKGYSELLNDLYGVYDDAEEIDWDSLPNEFVIKDTLGGGGNSVLIVRDKSKLDIEKTKKKISEWIKPTHGKHPGREWVYDKGKNRIIIEKYISSNPDEGGLIDYKFFCFNGKVEYVYGIADRKIGIGGGFGIFDRDFNQLPYTRVDERPLERKLIKPSNYEEMIQYSEKLSASFPHARIDLYDQNNKIMFGEITFFDGSGYMTFNPDEFDYIMGDCFELPLKKDYR